MDESDKENQPPKRRRLSLSLTRNHFKKVTEEDVSRAKKGYVPSNTARNTKWAVANFESWRLSLGKDLYPEDILLTDDSELLCSCLCKYVLDTRKESGEPYPPKSILNLLSGLLRYMRENKPKAFNIMDDKDPAFVELHKVLSWLISNEPWRVFLLLQRKLPVCILKVAQLLKLNMLMRK